MRRFNNSGPAVDSLSRSDSTLTWTRAGTTPEITRATFEYSSDGHSWTQIGVGTRIADPAAPGFPGWQLTGIQIPQSGTVRARGSLNGITGNGSHSFIETYSGSPVVLTDPVSLTNNAQIQALFSVAAAGSGPLSYQWFKDGVPLTNGSGLFGVDTDTLTVISPLRADEGSYRVTVSNSEGSFSSATVTLAVRDPLITLQPATQLKNTVKTPLLKWGQPALL